MNRDLLMAMLAEYREGLSALLGSRMGSVILYGSQARRSARDDSDIDVLVIMNSPFHYADLIHLTSELTASLSLKYDARLSRVFVSSEDYATRQLPLLMNVTKEGVLV